MKSKPQTTTPAAGKPRAAGREPVAIETGADSITIRISGRAYRNLARIADALARAEAERLAAEGKMRTTGAAWTAEVLADWLAEDMRMLAYARGAHNLLEKFDKRARQSAIAWIAAQREPVLIGAEG